MQAEQSTGPGFGKPVCTFTSESGVFEPFYYFWFTFWNPSEIISLFITEFISFTFINTLTTFGFVSAISLWILFWVHTFL
jgi:hypothetical protein